MKFRLSSEFGAFEEIREGRAHNGIDLAMPEGTELRSIADAVVERVVDYGGENIGKGVILRLEDGTNAIYGHMSDVSVKVGDVLKVGDTIGLSGNTGHSSGAHLHFALNKDGDWLDPTPIADELAEISGEGISWLDTLLIKGPLTNILWEGGKETIRENAKATTKEIIMGSLAAVGEVVMDFAYSVALCGTGLLIILRVVGYTPANKYIGLLPVSYVLLRYLFGGI